MRKKIPKTIQIIISVVVIAAGLFLIVALFPIKGNYQIKTVLSGSMEPTIKTGSVVILKPENSYKENDIVTFGNDTKTEIPTTHRIVSSRIQDGITLFTTKGDANNGSDVKEIKQSDIRGKVLFSVPLLGYIVNFIRQPVGLLLVIVIPAAVVIYDEARKIAKEVKKMRRKGANAAAKSFDNQNEEKENQT